MDIDRRIAPDENEKSVLVVEDEAILRLVVVEALSDSGVTIHEAGDGQRALGILEAEPSVAVLITDIKMPGMSGYQLAELGLAKNPLLKVVLMTGYAQDALPDSMRNAGVQVLYKPFDLEKLCTLAGQLLKGETRRAE